MEKKNQRKYRDIKALPCNDSRRCAHRRWDACDILVVRKQLPLKKRYYEDGVCPFFKQW